MRAFLLAPAILAPLAACAAPPRGSEPPPLSPGALRAELRGRAEAIRTASGTLSLRTEGLDRDGRCDAALVIAYPDRLHLQAYLSATTLFAFVLEGETHETYLPREERVVRGSLRTPPPPVSADAPRARFYRALADLLCRERAEEAGSCRVTETSYELTFSRGERRHLLSVDRRTLDIVRHRIETEGAPAVEILTEDFREAAPGLRWPYRVAVRGEGERPFTIAMIFQEVRLNEPLPPGAFRLAVPEGTRVENSP